MLVAGIQMQSPLGRNKENIAKALAYIDRAAKEGARMVCLQEFFSTGSFTPGKEKAHFELAQEENGELIQTMCRMARDKKVWLMVPFFEKDTEITGRYFNAVAVIDDQGARAGKYRKQYIPESVSCEKYYFAPGNLGTPVFEAAGLRFGVAVCYDRHFFEIWRTMLLKGAHVVFVPTATTRPKNRVNTWRMELTTLAVIHTMYVVGVNSTGFLDGKDQFGQSLMVDPLGNVLAALEEEEGLVLGEVSLEVLRKARIDFPILRDLRVEPVEELLQVHRNQGSRGREL